MVTTPPPPDKSQALQDQGAILGRFIIGVPVEPQFIDRYVLAHEHVSTEQSAPADAAILTLAMKRPILLPFLAAAASLVRRDSLLHKKSLLMAAILEASPTYADEFLPRPMGMFRLTSTLVVTGIVTAFQAAVGLPLLWFAGRRA